MEERADLRTDLESLRKALQEVEWRLGRVESALRLSPVRSEPQAAATPVGGDAASVGGTLEFKIGEMWLGQVGLVALLLGIAFFISYPFGAPPALQIVAGYLAAGALILLSRRWREVYAFGARAFFAGGLILVYFSTLRLHFFTPSPLISDKTVGLTLLGLVLSVLFTLAAARRAEHLGVIVLGLGFATSLCTDTGHFALALIVVTSAASVFLQWRFGWFRSVLLCVFLAYAAHLLWMFHSPVPGRPIQAVAASTHHLVYLFLCATLFGAANLPGGQRPDASPAAVALVFFNATGVYAVGAAAGWTAFRGRFAEVNLVFAAFFLGFAAIYWLRRQSTFATALYACFGYVALSAAIVTRLEGAERFIWLGWQGLLVISTAVWFRSKIVVVANVFIYTGTLLVYLLLEPPTLSVNLSYAAASLLSARLLNWQRRRLDLRTELMRNVYLASAFVIVPYGLYHGLPENAVSLSWLGVALFYFGVSLVLKNKKYRWMALWTMFLTVVHVFVVDLAGLHPAYRMVSFLALGLSLLAVSWIYAWHRRSGEDAPRDV